MAFQKPLPEPTHISAPFWEALQKHRIEIQQCGSCAHWVFYPRNHCPGCFSDDLHWKEVSGEAELLTYTITHIPTLPEFADAMPQMLAVVKLKEGPHMNSVLVDMAPEEIEVGMALKPVFDDTVPGKTTLLHFTKR